MALTLTQARTLTPEQQKRVLELNKAWSKEQAIWLAEKLYNLNQQTQTISTTPAKTVAPTTTVKPAIQTVTSPITTQTPTIPTTPAKTIVPTTTIKPATQIVATPVKPVTPTITPIAPAPVKSITTAPTTASAPTKATYNIKDFNAQQIQNMKDMKAQGKSDDEVRAVADRYLAIKKTPSIASAKPTQVATPPVTTTPKPTEPSKMVSIQWTNFLIDKKRWEEIAKNVMEGVKYDPKITSTRESYNAAFWYNQKPKEEQELLNRIWTIKIQPEIDKRNADIQTKAYWQLTSEETLKQTPDKLAEIEQDQLHAQNLKDTEENDRKIKEWERIINENSKALNTLYGFNDDGSIDTNNKNSLAYKTQAFFDRYKAEKDKVFAEFKSSQLNQIQGNMRASLASRWISPDNVSPEVLLALSWNIGIAWLDNINKAREASINNILAEEQNTLTKLNALYENNVINKNQAKTAIEVLRSQTKDARNAIDRQWRSDLLWVAKWEVARKEWQKWEVVNAVTKFGEALWLSGTSMEALSTYLSWFTSPTEAIKQMIIDLKNPESNLVKQIGIQEAKRTAAAVAEAQLKLDIANINKQKTEKDTGYTPWRDTYEAVATAFWLDPKQVTDADIARFYKDPALVKAFRAKNYLPEAQWQ